MRQKGPWAMLLLHCYCLNNATSVSVFLSVCLSFYLLERERERESKCASVRPSARLPARVSAHHEHPSLADKTNTQCAPELVVYLGGVVVVRTRMERIAWYTMPGIFLSNWKAAP